jgi:triose-phosphate isomerase
MKYLIFNLKSNFKYNDLILYADQINALKSNIIIAPSNIYLNYLNNLGFETCAQDVSKYNMGSYTGEVNASQIKSIGTNFALIGHQERRKYFNEDNDLIDKVKSCLDNNLKVIYCVGNDLKDDNLDDIKLELDKLFDLKISSDQIVLAYEPLWAIGNDNLPDINYINEKLTSIKEYIKNKYSLNIDILYGGSIHSKDLNLLEQISSNGLLIGHSSLNVDEIFTLSKLAKH